MRCGGRKGEFALAPARLNRGWRQWPLAKPWWCHGLDAGERSGCRHSDREANRRAPHGLIFFPGIPKLVQIVKSKWVPYRAPKFQNFA
jgi:hypothetical protein